MKKYMKKLVYCAIFCIMAFTSCSEDPTLGHLYKESNNAVAFPQNTITHMANTMATVDSCDIQVMRSNASGSVSISIQATDTSGIFSVPEQITFADGSYYTTVRIHFDPSKLTYEKKYVISITLPATEVVSRNHTCEVYISRPYNWQTIDIGIYTAALWGQEWPQELQHVDGTNLYRLKDLFTEGYHLIFIWEEGTTELQVQGEDTELVPGITLTKNISGVTDPDYGMIYLYTNKAIYDSTTKTFSFINYWGVNAGLFNKGNPLMDIYTFE